MDLVQDSASAAGLGDAGKRVMEQYELESEIKKREKATAGAGKAAQAKIMETYGGVLSKPYEEFKPSQESLGGFAALGSLLMVAGAMMGGKGRLSGIGAMNNIAGMMKGYQQGRKDLYEQERQQFEQNMKTFEKNRGMIKEAFDRALKIAPTNLKLANDMLRRDLQALGASVPAEMVGKSGAVQAAGSYQTFSQNTDKTLEQLRAQLSRSKALTQAEEADIKAKKTARELAGTGAPVRIQFEGKTVLADRTGKPLRNEKGEVIEAPERSTGVAQRQQNQRIINATAGAASAFEAIKSIKGGTTTGILPFLGDKEGMLSFLKTAAGRALTDDDAKILDVYYAGLARNIAAIEASGAATGLVGLTKTFESLKPMVGDSNYVVAAKLADGRRLVEETVNALIDSKILTDDQAKTAEKLVGRVEKAIPYTVTDVNNALAATREPDAETIGTATESAVKPDANLPTPQTQEDFDKLKPGTRYIDPDDGKIYIK